MTKAAVTFYDILGLTPGAADEDVRRAYRTLALRWHPDRNPQNRPTATHYTALLNRAYAHLRTAPQRRAYDRFLDTKRLPAPPSSARGAAEKDHGLRRDDGIFSLLKEIFWPLAPMEAAHG